MLELVFLKRFSVFLKNREMHKRVAVLIERHDKTGKIHLAAHFEIEEIAIEVDAALHQIVVDEAGIKRPHEVLAPAVAI